MSLSLSATSLIGIGQAPSLIARSDPEPIGIAPFLPIIRSSCPLSSSTGSLVVVLSGFNNRIWRSFTKSGAPTELDATQKKAPTLSSEVRYPSAAKAEAAKTQLQIDEGKGKRERHGTRPKLVLETKPGLHSHFGAPY
ncbi:hypothetical protein U1Q18_039226 [Sarracenia purpurea var. burkii]